MVEQDDLNELLNEAVEVATDHLVSGTEFLPFALATQADDGEIFHLEPDEDDAEADPSLVLAALRGGLRDAAREGRWKAVAVVTDVTVEDPDGEAVTSAIQIWLEHAEGASVSCTIPYSIGEDTVELAELAAEPADPIIFAVAPPPN